jgi:predicted AlkP superfamily pyrophosphatase or phosphodiesterase
MRHPIRIILALALCGSAFGPALRAADTGPRHAVLVSIDGLMPDYFLKADALGLEIPNLRRLMREGAYGRVIGVLPTVTYPSHTTLLTGVPPRVHGIGSNTVFDPLGISGEAWQWFASDIRVPTLISAARSRGLTTAAVSWPVSVGLDTDWNLPEFWRPGSTHPFDLKLLDLASTPGLRRMVEEDRGSPFPYPLTDRERADTAVYILKAHRPHLLLLHIFALDSAQHDHGPMTPEAKEAVEKSDTVIGRLLEAVESAGLATSTAFIVVSDHGFLPVSRSLKPNVVLREAGLVKLNDKGKVASWGAFFQADGGSAALRLPEGADPALVERIRGLFAPRVSADGGLREILDAKAIAAFGGIEEAALVLDARDGFSFSGALQGEWSSPSTSKGTHGYAPNRDEMHASLLILAPGLRQKGNLGTVRMTAIAPTLARYLGLDLPPPADAPLPAF